MTTHDDQVIEGGDHNPSAGYCSDAVSSLYLFLDGELDEVRMTEIRAHLEACSPCFEAFDFEAELRIVIAARVREQSVPEDFRQRLLTMLESFGSSGGTPPPAFGGPAT
jgi:anti-sigma factor (TIGR02949 family)